jgi:arylsulfatase A-like enzyme
MKSPYQSCLNLFAGFLLLGVPAASAQIPENPNVLLIVCDDLNDFEGAFGGHPQAQTPNIDSFAAGAVRFMNAHSNAPICGPSRSSFITGIYPHTSGVFAFENWYDPEKDGFSVNPLLQNSKTLMHYMRDNGYQSFGTGKLMHKDLADDYVYPAGHPEAGNLQEFWDEYGAKSTYGPVAFNPNANGGAGEAVNHPKIPDTFYNRAGALNSLFGSLADVPTVNGYTGWWKSSWLSAGSYTYVDDNNRDDMQDEEVRKWAAAKINALAASDPTGENEKFILSVGFHNPHTPFVAPQEYFDLYPIETLQLPPRIANDVDDTHFNKNAKPTTSTLEVYSALVDSVGEVSADGTSYATEEDFIKAYLQAYLACVSFVDAQVGALIAALDASPYADNTIVILTSDHGYEWGEKEALSKNTLWNTSTRVPLAIRVPGLEANANSQVSHPVSLIDLYPTIRDLCGLTSDTKKNASGADLDGHSLRPFLENPATTDWDGPDVALTQVSASGMTEATAKNFSVSGEDWRYIRYENGAEELYDLANDPYEFINLADSSDPAVQTKRSELQNALFGFVPSLATEPSNALADAYFDWLGGNGEPNAGNVAWDPIDEPSGNIWQIVRENSFAHKGNYCLRWSQRWVATPVVQNLNLQWDSADTYICSFWMRSKDPADLGGLNDAAISIELWTSPTLGSGYAKRADLVVDATNTTANTWQQFSGTFDAAALSAYDGEYIQFRIQRNENVRQRVYVDDFFFDGLKTDSFEEWAFDNGINKTTTGYDLDKDGLVNLLEFGFGGLPDDATSTGHAPTIEYDGSNLVYSYPRRKNAALTYQVETSPSLVPGNWSENNFVELPMTGEYDPDFDRVSNTLSMGDGKLFARIRLQP